MKPRGQRLACSLRTLDGCVGSYDVFPGETPKSSARVDPVTGDWQPKQEVLAAAFSVIGNMGMPDHIIRANQYQWRALPKVKLQEPFYPSILWGGSPLK